MKNTACLLIILIALGTTFSCKKKKDTIPATTPANYQPISAGSTWTYASTSNSVTSNYTLTATANDSTIDGKAYKIFINSSGPNEYYYKTGNDYYRYSYFEALSQSLNLLYLKDNLSVGQSWTQNKNATINGVSGTAILECVVAEKGISYPVNGKTFTNVMHIKINPTFSVNGIILTNNKADIHYYFADNVGFIYSSTDLSVAIPFSPAYNYVGEVKLTAYNIK